MNVTLDELEAFVCIAGGAGFTEASRRLHRSQPAISRRIHQLEEGLGAPLFERVGRRVRLTDAGRALLPHAEAALAALRDGERAVRDVAERAAGPLALRLAIVGTLADAQIVAALREFQARHEGTSVELRTANSREVSDLVRRGEADLGVRYHADPGPSLESIALGVEQRLVVVPRSHRMRAKRVADLRAFAGDRWLGFPPDPRQPEASLERFLVAAGIPTPELTPVDSLTAQKRLVEAGLGIALLPRSSVREELRLGRLRAIEVRNLDADQPVFVVRRKSSYQSPLARSFLALLLRGAPKWLGRARGHAKSRRRPVPRSGGS